MLCSEIQRQIYKTTLYIKIYVSKIYGRRSRNFTILKSRESEFNENQSQSRSRTKKMAESQSQTDFAQTLLPWFGHMSSLMRK